MSSEDHLKLTESQSKSLDELRKRMEKDSSEDTIGYWDDARILYRFLKARDFDVIKAEVLLRKSIEWRKQNEQVIRDYKPSEFLKTYFANLHVGFDKEEQHVFYLPLGKYDVKGLYKAAKYSDIEKFIVKTLLEMENNLENKYDGNGRMTKFVIIFDENGITFANTLNKSGIGTLIRLAQLQQDIFPERLKNLYIINVPSYFTFGFNIVKNFLSPETLKKIRVYGSDGWKDDLLDVIPADQLPQFLGGSRTDPDGNPMCNTILNQGGPIPESYYIHRSKTSLAQSPGVQRLRVSRSSSTQVSVQVSEPGSLIEWEFETRSGDIAFGINYIETQDSVAQAVVPFQRFSTNDFSEVGMYKCDKSGTYIVMFDNSYSWLRSKEIYYRINVVGNNAYEDQLRG